MVVYLLELMKPLESIGFGVIRLMEKRYWLTGGLKEAHRGQGYGQFLFQSLVDLTPSKEVWVDILTTNGVGKYIYTKLGFKDVETKKNEHDQDIIIMRLNKLEGN